MVSKHTILIVDDDERNRRMIGRIFKGQHRLITAQSGEEALEIISDTKPDLILLDIAMEGIDGYETTRRIRKDSRFKFIKIILVSGKTSVEERLTGYKAGADDYVTKPFVHEELEAKVRVFLRLKRAEEVDTLKDDLLVLFSHETKTPLSGIIGLSELIRSNAAIDPDTREFAELINKDGRRLLEFVKKTAFLVELKKGAALRIKSEALKAHLHSAVEKVSAAAANRNVAVDQLVGPDIVLEADWAKMDRVFGYLVDNSVKFSPSGGTVSVRADLSDGNCLISFQDQGSGIAPDWIDKIFDEFAIQDIQHHQKGQGLSLAITKHVVELHGGTIRAESAPGEGAMFILKLPPESPAD
jgi:two-component system sensor histidine kinase/response regulator